MKARSQAVELAILKDLSPSCGVTEVYDGKFSGKTTDGQGVTASLLEKNHVRVFSQNQIREAADYLEELEGSR